MNLPGGTTSTRRARWVALFTLFLLAAGAAPVLAVSGEERPAEPPDVSLPQESTGIDPALRPDGDDVAAGIERLEAEEAENAEQLAGKEAISDREKSRHAFSELGAAGSKQLLRVLFADQLARLDNDPARLLSDTRVLSYLGDNGAVVEYEGDRQLLEGTVPLRARDEKGDLRKLDLTLSSTATGFEPENPLTEVTIPSAPEGPVGLGDEGLSIRALDTEGQGASLFEEKSVFYPEVHEDSDRLVAPTGMGVELFDLLRSRESPETLRYRIEVPEGGTLRADDRGGAEVVLGDGEITARIRPPTAVDAQGTDVPVALSVQRETIELNVPHRGGDFAYPLLVDPIIEAWNVAIWFNGYNIYALENGAWQWDTNSSWIYGSTWPIYHDFAGSHRGLHFTTKSGNFGSNRYGHWYYAAPNLASFVGQAGFWPFWYEDHGCAKYYYQQPDDYVGLWDAGNGAWTALTYNDSYYKGYSEVGYPNSYPGWGHSVVLGASTGPGMNIPCWRDWYVGGAIIYLDDWASPTVSNIGGIPSGWIGEDAPLTLTGNASDAGLGVKEVVFDPAGSVGQFNVKHGCNGLAGNRCPTSWGAQKNLTGLSLDEGKRQLTATAQDALGKASTAKTAYTKVDRTPPQVTLDGQLAEVTEEDKGAEQGAEEVEELTLPVYKLKIEATDGSNAEGKLRRSGVKNIEIRLDGEEQEVPWSAQSCPSDSCTMTKTYELQLHDVSPGEHTLEVDVEDHVGETRERNIEFEYFPATGMKDGYVMHHFPLPDGQGNEEEEELPARPELAVNVANGNLVYRERDVDVEGPAVDLEVERFYNSMLPEGENTEWGDGWTLAQTPKLDPEEVEGSPPSKASMLQASGAMRHGVGLATGAGQSSFDPELQATITTEAGGGYTLTDETGESPGALAFDAGGKVTELRTDGTVKIDYAYEGGELSEIAVSDPATWGVQDPAELEIPEPPPLDPPSFAYLFGNYGDDEGEFESPADVAIDSEGDIWVLDAANARVQHFSPVGLFLGEFGSEGYEDGQMRHPTAIEIDVEGNLWILDSYNERVQKFNQQGEFLAKWGAFGTEPGELISPEGMAIDAEGNFWIADTWNSRIQKFSPAGSLLQVAGESGEGELSEPRSLAVGPEGEVFVVDRPENRVVVFDKSGKYLRQFGSEGYGEGQFHNPYAVEVDTQGSVWVVDGGDEQLEQFDTEGTFIAQFGSEGTGTGEFEFAGPTGLAADPEGGLWIVDSGNYRMQRWVRGDYRPSYEETVGSAGTGDGEFDLPGDVAIDSEGDLWVVDALNDRVQQLDPEGAFISEFGSPGSEEGQLDWPTAIEVDAEDNIWVADADNNRLQKFNQAGQPLAAIGDYGAAEGKLNCPEGLAIDRNGDIWVADTWNHRIQKFSPSGEFLKAFGASGEGELEAPMGIDVAFGEVFVADWLNHRVVVFDEEGEYLREFGSFGYGWGQFRSPNALEVDPGGNVWVGDEGNERILRFSVEGEFITDFGSEGAGEGELELTRPSGVAADDEGGIWVTDSGNDRLQRWQRPDYVPAPDPQLTDADPRVAIETPEGLVGSVAGEEAGEHSYEHEGELLTAVDGPDGETEYEYEDELLTKVTLPNGTWGEIDYYPDDGRVKSVTIDPAGEEPAKTTYFYFSDEPRRTEVDPPDAPYVTYDIGPDGSVLKWWNTEEPPLFDDLSGTLYDSKETSSPIEHGDHTLNTTASSPEGIASIEVIADGDTLVDEVTCEQDPEEPGVECEEVVNQWVTSTNLNAPGRLYLEVVITDSLGNSASERFWVEIPEPPPPPAPGAPVPPTYKEIKEFREEYGLEVVFPVANEIELNERIFELIGAWYNGNSPEGKVARASMGRWGVPLRPQDIAELEYREWYLAKNTPLISQWGEANHPSSYAGVYMDHPTGGKIRVGFTADQESKLNALRAAPNIVANSRLAAFSSEPDYSLATLRAASLSFDQHAAGSPDVLAAMTTGEIDVRGNDVKLRATDTGEIANFIDQYFGPNAPFSIDHDPSKPMTRATPYEEGVRFRELNSRLYSGDWIRLAYRVGECTLGFGAWERKPTPSGVRVVHYGLTAGHCNFVGTRVQRAGFRLNKQGEALEDEVGFGTVRRNSLGNFHSGFETDSSAIRLDSTTQVPRWVYWSSGYQFMVNGVADWIPGMTLCHSGTYGGSHCGPTRAVPVKEYYEGENRPATWQIHLNAYGEGGDSGGPVWDPVTGSAVGSTTGGPPKGKPTLVTPLLPLEGKPYAQEVGLGTAPGILAVLGSSETGPLHIIDGVK